MKALSDRIGQSIGASGQPLLANVYLHYTYSICGPSAVDGGSHGMPARPEVLPYKIPLLLAVNPRQMNRTFPLILDLAVDDM
jgi:hypothetical protein